MTASIADSAATPDHDARSRSGPTSRRSNAPRGLDAVVRARSLGVGRPLRQQCLAAGMPASVHQGRLGQRHPSVAGRCRATRHIADGDVVEIATAARTLRGPARIREGQADGVIAVTLGTAAPEPARIGNGIGFDAYELRRSKSRRGASTMSSLITTGRARRPFRRCSINSASKARRRTSIRCMTLGRTRARASGRPNHDVRASAHRCYPEFTYDSYAWAMVIDTSVCIGCNACVVACQAENNVPVVGPEEVSVGARHALAAHRPLRAGPEQAARLPAGALHALREGAVRAGLPGGGFRARRRRASTCRSTTAASARASARRIAPTRCAASTGSAMPTARNTPTSATTRDKAAQQSRRHRARARRHGEVHLLRPAHQPRAARSRKGQTAQSPTAKSSPPARPPARPARSLSATATTSFAGQRHSAPSRTTTPCSAISAPARAPPISRVCAIPTPSSKERQS